MTRHAAQPLCAIVHPSAHVALHDPSVSPVACVQVVPVEPLPRIAACTELLCQGCACLLMSCRVLNST